ncbi:hypothetical protein AC622_04215 [Bacillus sp. FJAT-27916]|nr:hypothetical protein AC622_04215 [Bacillus sp. FJAT-27916]
MGESPVESHPVPMQKGDERWEECGRSVALPRESPPFTHTKGMKGGESVGEARHCPGEAHPLPIQGG